MIYFLKEYFSYVTTTGILNKSMGSEKLINNFFIRPTSKIKMGY